MSIRIILGSLVIFLLAMLTSNLSIPDVEKLPPIERIDARVYTGKENSLPWISFNPQLDPQPSLLKSAPGHLIEYRYHLSIKNNAQRKYNSLLITQAINGTTLYHEASQPTLPLSTPTIRTVWHRPLLLPINKHATTEPIILYSTSWEPHLFVSPIYIGSETSLFWIYETIYLISTSLAITGTIVSLLFGLFFTRIWLTQQKDNLYFYAAITALSWSMLFLLLNIPYQPIYVREIWRFFIYCTIAISFWGIAKFIQHYTQSKIKKLLSYAQTTLAISGPFLYLITQDNESLFDRYWTQSLYLVVSPAVIHILYYWHKDHKNQITTWMSIITVLCLYFAHQSQQLFSGFVNTYPAINDVKIYHLFDTPLYLINLFFPLFFLVCSIIFIERYKIINQKLSASAERMHQKLEQQALEINLLNSERLAKEKKDAADAERNAIYQDLHDGIGARLVACLYKLRNNHLNKTQLEETIIDSLKDIKKIIDTNPTQHISDFANHLFEQCFNLESVFDQSKIRYSYNIQHDTNFSFLHRIDYHILFIFQETIANFVKYSQAQSLSIEMHVSNIHFTLRVIESDYPVAGQPLKPDTVHHNLSSGRGISNMHARSLTIQGHLDIDQDHNRRITRLIVPLWILNRP